MDLDQELNRETAVALVLHQSTRGANLHISGGVVMWVDEGGGNGVVGETK